MRLEGMLYCEAPDCEERARVDTSVMELGRLPEGYVKLTRYGDNGRDSEHGFCCLDCAMLWCALRSPPETIDAGDLGFGGGEQRGE